ncbi:hypothetical protein [Xanthomonas sp. XNM01]|uniref:hypothetical protein n=1 Tax=Xanthomonas sp. XNM01 TaxID=2769289 RepID=UPI001786B113|nr:hypothetical protein [Xanthomonas sp. XNM01]MBD9368827.1 hypothetical protein [Xanthomonas sp. XNM01]
MRNDTDQAITSEAAARRVVRAALLDALLLVGLGALIGVGMTLAVVLPSLPRSFFA